MIEALKKKLSEEAEKLRYELNVTLPAEIRRAVEMGDLRENSEYKAALERQKFVQARLGQLGARLAKLWNYERYGTPFERGGKFFWTHNSGLQNQAVFYAADSLDAKPREEIRSKPLWTTSRAPKTAGATWWAFLPVSPS